MPTTKRTISVRLDPAAARRLERAARLMKQSRDAFLGKAGDDTARRILLKWAVARYRQGERTRFHLVLVSFPGPSSRRRIWRFSAKSPAPETRRSERPTHFRNRVGERSFSQLAEETGLTVEEIMGAAGNGDREAALAMFLTSCKTVAEVERNPEFLRLGQEAARAVAGERQGERC